MGKLLAGRYVLVVEDEMMVLMNIEWVLGNLGCKDISAAATVDGALALIGATRQFDIAMLDINLGGETSYQVADTLALQNVPFIFTTGYGKRSVDVRYCDRPVLQKPYRDDELGNALAALLVAGHAA